MSPWNPPKLGLFGSLALWCVCALPLHWLGFSDNVALFGGLALAVIVYVGLGVMRRSERIEEMRDASHR